MIRAYADNVILRLDPPVTETKSGLYMPDTKNQHRFATVIDSGPGYHTAHGAFVPNDVRPGDRVIVDRLAGQNYSLDFSIPRHNKSTEFGELFGDSGEFRIVREQEIHCVVEEAMAAE